MTTELSLTSEKKNKKNLSTNTYKSMSGISLWGKKRITIHNSIYFTVIINKQNKTPHLSINDFFMASLITIRVTSATSEASN